MLWLLSFASLEPPASSLRAARVRAVGVQPRGNAVVREARSAKTKPVLVEPKQTDRLRAEAMSEYGLNLNDYWTLRSGTIADSLPSSSAAKGEALDRAQRQAAAEVADRKRLAAERRLQAAVHSRGAMQHSDARAAARLCMAIAEARRLGCRIPQLLRQAEALHALLERAAAEEYARRQRGEPVELQSFAAAFTALDAEEPSDREALVLKVAREWERPWEELDDEVID